MSKHTMYKNLSCDLSEKEIAVYSQELARVTGEQFEIENEKKEALSTFTARLAKCVADRNVLARKVITKKEDRQVECDLDFDYARGMVYTVRMDTGVTIDQRKLTDDERQERLDFEGEQDAAQAVEEKAEVAAVSEPTTVAEPLTEETIAARDEVCHEWRECKYSGICFDEEKNTAGDCFKDNPEALAEITKTGESLPVCGNTGCASFDLQCFDHCAISGPDYPTAQCSAFKPEVAA